jgi:hypothetical protein
MEIPKVILNRKHGAIPLEQLLLLCEALVVYSLYMRSAESDHLDLGMRLGGASRARELLTLFSGGRHNWAQAEEDPHVTVNSHRITAGQGIVLWSALSHFMACLKRSQHYELFSSPEVEQRKRRLESVMASYQEGSAVT